MRRPVSCILFFFMGLSLQAQSVNIKGSVADENKVPLYMASVSVQSFPDSVSYYGLTDIAGNFSIYVPAAAESITVTISYLGYARWTKTVNPAGNPVDLGAVALVPDITELDNTIIEDKLPLAIQKGDTVQYNADAFKTAPDASAEDLIKKMPGIDVNGGKVQTQGEDVKQVLVDGKPFFGDDPNAALKNLPADVIAQIQVYDQASDQSQFTGFDDGNTSKTINIITKPEKHNGTFGRIYGGYGYLNKYQAGGNVNFFKKDTRLSLVFQSNNINNQNFSAEDITGISSGSGGGRRGGGGGGSDFSVSPSNGIATTHALGLNYSDQWGKKWSVTGSYFFNYIHSNSIQQIRREYYQQADSVRIYNESNEAVSDNFNHRINFKIQFDIDSNNSITFRPKFSVQHGGSHSETIGNTMLSGLFSNSTSSRYSSANIGFRFDGDLTYKHKFAKEGRTFSINLTSGYNLTDRNGSLSALNIYYQDTAALNDSIDQRSMYLNNMYSVGGKLEYTEPVGKISMLSFSYNPSWQSTASEKYTRNFDPVMQDYTMTDSILSNDFTNGYFSQKAGLSYRIKKDKLNFSVGVFYQHARLDVQNYFPGTGSFVKNFHNILPTAMLNIKLSKAANMRIAYRTSTAIPSSTQLQRVVDNSNPLVLFSGNPDLRQTWNHNFTFRYGNTNTEKATVFFAMMRFSLVKDYIGSSTFVADNDTVISGILLSRGVQLSRPVNFDYQMSANVLVTYGVPVPKIKTNFNVSATADYSRTPGLLNNQINYADVTGFGLGVGFTSNINENVDFRISSRPSYSLVMNTLREDRNNNYFRLTTEASLKWMFWKGMYVETQLSHQFFQGLSQSLDPNIVLWNAGFGYRFLKDKSLDLKFSVFDILNENNSISRNVTETYVEDVQTNALTRFFMLTLAWKFSKF